MWFLFAFTSAVLSSASSILEKKVLFKEHALQVSAKLSFYCFLISVPFFIISNQNFSYRLTPLVIIAATAVLGGIAFLLVMKSVRHMEISEVSPFIALGPALTALFGFIFLGEILTMTQIIGLSIIVFGIYLLELKNTSNLLSPFKLIFCNKYILFVLLSLLIYGVTDVLSKYVLSKYGFKPGAYLFYYQLFLALFYLLLLRLKQNSFQSTPKISHRDNWFLVLIAILTLGYRYFHISAMSLVSIGIALAVYRSSTLFTTIIGGTLYKEGGLVRKSIAAIAVICGVILIAL